MSNAKDGPLGNLIRCRGYKGKTEKLLCCRWVQYHVHTCEGWHALLQSCPPPSRRSPDCFCCLRMSAMPDELCDSCCALQQATRHVPQTSRCTSRLDTGSGAQRVHSDQAEWFDRRGRLCGKHRTQTFTGLVASVFSCIRSAARAMVRIQCLCAATGI